MDAIQFNSTAYPQSRCGQDDSRIKRVLPLMGAPERVLDVGCLDGTIGELFLSQGSEVYGLDASRPAIEKAASRGIKAKLGNVEEDFPFENEFFDAVFAGEIIEHVFDVDKMLSEMHRVLKPDGFAIVTTPNLAALGRRLMLLLNRNPHIEISFKGNAAGHIRYFVKSELLRILRVHGFRVECFCSDVVNFNSSGSLRSVALARMFPTLGRALIVKAIKVAPDNR
ncbi:MAG: class I SAM-dependent methyltransferase [Smithellaceae bacterium]|jgi:2-polyprenyl-3-methyl-5-hydroxy-6-metoxy-1,4-benzoquinol methylase|nr:class I SAM-dependent methyltransferase [Smithellaceae bacterium]